MRRLWSQAQQEVAAGLAAVRPGSLSDTDQRKLEKAVKSRWVNARHRTAACRGALYGTAVLYDSGGVDVSGTSLWRVGYGMSTNSCEEGESKCRTVPYCCRYYTVDEKTRTLSFTQTGTHLIFMYLRE